MRKLLSLLLVLLMVSSLFIGCGKNEEPTVEETTAAATTAADTTAADTTTVGG